MSRQSTRAHFGEPDLEVVGLRLWVHGRERPASDGDDGNWLRVTAHCRVSGASVEVHGSILMVSDIARFGDECSEMLRGIGRMAHLEPFEPELKVSLARTDDAGHIRATVEITPDHLAQAHRFEFDIDQSYLPGIIRQCSAIVDEYPLR